MHLQRKARFAEDVFAAQLSAKGQVFSIYSCSTWQYIFAVYVYVTVQKNYTRINLVRFQRCSLQIERLSFPVLHKSNVLPCRGYFCSAWDLFFPPKLLPMCCWLRESWGPSVSNDAAVQGLPAWWKRRCASGLAEPAGRRSGFRNALSESKSSSFPLGYPIFTSRASPGDLPIPSNAESRCFSSSLSKTESPRPSLYCVLAHLLASVLICVFLPTRDLHPLLLAAQSCSLCQLLVNHCQDWDIFFPPCILSSIMLASSDCEIGMWLPLSHRHKASSWSHRHHAKWCPGPRLAWAVTAKLQGLSAHESFGWPVQRPLH